MVEAYNSPGLFLNILYILIIYIQMMNEYAEMAKRVK